MEQECGMRIEILVFDGVDELDAIGPLEILKTAVTHGAPFDIAMVTVGGTSEVVGAHGLRFAVHGPHTADTNVIIVPGGGWITRSKTGAWREAREGNVPRAIANAADLGAIVASVCTGAMLVAAAGLASGRNMTTHHGAVQELAAAGAVIGTDRVIDDGNLISSGGVTCGLDLALWLVERLASSEISARVASDLEYTPQRPAPTP